MAGPAAEVSGPIVATSARRRRDRLVAPALTGVGAATVVTALGVRDPHVEGSWGFCPFLLLTGAPCPGCGGLRAVHDLTRLDVPAALSSNAVAVLLLLGAVVAWALWTVRRWRGSEAPMVRLGVRTSLLLVGVWAVFSVVRWTPWGAGLAP